MAIGKSPVEPARRPPSIGLTARLAITVYERASGRRPWSEAARLGALQWQPPETLEALAAERLQRLLAHAAAHVPYYRSLFRTAGLTAETVRRPADLTRLPISTKAALGGAFPHAVVAENLPPSRRVARITGGSTGVPFPFFADRATPDLRVATYLLFRDWLGVSARDARLHIASPVHFQSRPSSLQSLLRRLIFGERLVVRLGARFTLDELRRDVARLARHGRYFLWTYPSYAARLAAQMLDRGIELAHAPAAIVCYAETLTAGDAALIARAFGRPVSNLYSCMEVPLLAFTCPDQRELMHVNTQRALVRVVREDGADAAPGERGRVVITDLANYVMPFINYEIGDEAVGGPPCSCGRGFPTLRTIEGRSAEIIRTPDGRVVGASALNGFLLVTCAAGALLAEFQAEQTAGDTVVLRVVPRPGFTPTVATGLEKRLRELFGPRMHARIEVVRDIAVEPSGKRLIIRPPR